VLESKIEPASEGLSASINIITSGMEASSYTPVSCGSASTEAASIEPLSTISSASISEPESCTALSGREEVGLASRVMAESGSIEPFVQDEKSKIEKLKTHTIEFRKSQ
jgi:hypothetical protein